MNVGDKVRVKPNEKHYHSNGIGTLLTVHPSSPGAFNVYVEMVSPTRRPSLMPHAAFRFATVRRNFYFDELEVVA